MAEVSVPIVLNRDMLSKIDGPLCEWEPSTKRPAMLSDPYHAPATMRVGAIAPHLRVCATCAERLRHRYNSTPQPLDGGY